MRPDVSFELNGKPVSVDAAGGDVLLDTLREEFGLRSVRRTCGVGTCGSCTVLIDGRAHSSCITLTRQVAGRKLVTSEGLVDSSGTLHRVQEAFVRHGAYQCSFCIPGMVLSTCAFLSEDGQTLEEARDYLAGNLCRCGTYPQIMAAVEELVPGPGDALEGSK